MTHHSARSPLFIDLRTVREQAGLTQTELAERLRTKQSAIARWEKHQDSMSLHSFIGYVLACGFYPLSEEIMVPVEEARDFVIANPGKPMTWKNLLYWKTWKDIIPAQYPPGNIFSAEMRFVPTIVARPD
jgi:transcriptional regulator with XRE-family HTH domain